MKNLLTQKNLHGPDTRFDPSRGSELPPFDIEVEFAEAATPGSNTADGVQGHKIPPPSPGTAAPSPATRVAASPTTRVMNPSPKTRVRPQTIEPQAWLTIVKGTVYADWVPLAPDNATYIGRGLEHRNEDGSIWRKNHFAFKDFEPEQIRKINEEVSKSHAEIFCSGGTYNLLVTEGRNVTKIIRGEQEILLKPGSDIGDAKSLQNGDIIRIGAAEAKFIVKT
jgi:hypothetical protein